jgi:hypothetical protein
MKNINLRIVMKGMAVLALAIFLFAQCGGRRSSGDKDAKSGAKSADKEVVKEKPQEQTGSTPKFTYLPPEPDNSGVLKGVVELGSTGFNSFVVKIDGKKRWQLKKSEFGSSLVYENLTTKQDVVNGLKNYISDMINYGVAGKYIYFVVSSSAVKVDKVKDIIKELKSMGYVVHTVTADEEAQWGFNTTIPDEYKKTGFMVDIGSGNTKIAWFENGQMQTRETYGAKYKQNDVDDGKVEADIVELTKAIPADKRGYCFIIGGVPFKMAQTHRTDKERYTVLKEPASYQFEGEREQSGVNIYSAIRKGSGCNTFVFDWDANFVIGYLLK